MYSHNKNLLSLILAFAGILHPHDLRSQTLKISLSAGTHVSADSPHFPFVETFLAANPRDPKNLIATAMVNANGVISTRIYSSHDGGNGWVRAKTSTDNIAGADPVVYFDSNGTAFFAFVAQDSEHRALFLSRSGDGGTSWGMPIAIPGGVYDRPYLAFDNTGGKFNGRIYIGGTIRITEFTGRSHQAIGLAFSADNGRTFSSPQIITGDWQGEDSDEISDLVVTPNGGLLICFEAAARLSDIESGDSGHFWTIVSDDGGLTFSKAIQGPRVAAGKGQQMLKSAAAPRLNIDSSQGPYRGRLYLSWTDFDGKRYAVKVSHSTDLGLTWSAPVIVNDNEAEGDPASPALAVAASGVVGVAFYDRRDDPNNSCFRLYFSASVDGGESFLPNVQASHDRTCPQAVGNWAAIGLSGLPPLNWSKGTRRPVVSVVTMPSRFPNGGDTQGLIVGSDGVFRSAWIDGETGLMQLWYNEIKIDGATMSTHVPKTPGKDVSTELTLRICSAEINLERHIASVRVRLFNPLPVTILGPFTVMLEDASGALKGLRVLNSDNAMPGRGAIWGFTVNAGKQQPQLRPQQESDERILSWKFDGGPSGEARVPLSAHFSILAGPN